MDKEAIEKVLEGKSFVSISRIKIETGLSGHTIANYLKKTGRWRRYTKGKSSRPIWERLEEEVLA